MSEANQQQYKNNSLLPVQPNNTKHILILHFDQKHARLPETE